MADPLLVVQDLGVRFTTPDGVVQAVNHVSFRVLEGEALGIVGESGSGKSQTVLGIMGLLARNGCTTGAVHFKGRELLALDKRALNRVRGKEISMIFQDPMTSLNPYLTVGRQMTEVVMLHEGLDKREANRRAVDMLDAVRIPEAKSRLGRHPHEFSGGMRQRVMIAMALLCRPDLLIADEPTTALDVTVQAEIIVLLDEIRRELKTAIILITHDLGVVAGLCEQVMVMYAGGIVESGSIDALFARPQHPYTRGLLDSVPRLDREVSGELSTIPGNPPNLQHLPPGCPFNDRCQYRLDRCASERPLLRQVERDHHKACHLETLP